MPADRGPAPGTRTRRRPRHEVNVMPDRPRLSADRRTETGKAVARLRHAGRLPAVVYGHGTPSESLSLDTHEFELLHRHAGATTLIDLKVDGGRARPVLIHGIQVHPVSRRPLHVDLLAVRMTEELQVDVPILASGEAPALINGGTLFHAIESVRIRALPGDLPEAIEYPLDALVDYDASILVRDLIAPKGVTILADPELLIARVLPPRVEIEPEVVAAAEAGAAAGEEAAGAPPVEEPATEPEGV
jgi:large subunit ribosomal protein L25